MTKKVGTHVRFPSGMCNEDAGGRVMRRETVVGLIRGWILVFVLLALWPTQPTARASWVTVIVVAEDSTAEAQGIAATMLS